MSFRVIPTSGSSLVAFLRTLADRLDRIEKGSLFSGGTVSFKDEIQIGAVKVVVVEATPTTFTVKLVNTISGAEHVITTL